MYIYSIYIFGVYHASVVIILQTVRMPIRKSRVVAIRHFPLNTPKLNFCCEQMRLKIKFIYASRCAFCVGFGCMCVWVGWGWVWGSGIFFWYL